ncbi:hypothetical protein R6Q57_026998 [Mikania cordata]
MEVSRYIFNPVENAQHPFLPVNLSSKINEVIMKLHTVFFVDVYGQFEDDVCLPTGEPHGSIEASLSRIQSRM